MDKKAKLILISLLVAVIGGLVAFAGSYQGQTVGSVPILVLIVGIVFVIQWIMYAHSWFKQTDRFYDLTGGITYITMTILALILSQNLDARAWILGAIVIIWAARLSSFLFIRVTKSGGDSRFEERLKQPATLFLTWTLQGLWVVFTALASWIGITSTVRKDFGWIATIGLILWVIGFTFELIADYQKTQFNKKPENKGKFISKGIWSISRHPNYFGEIVMWTGALIIVAPTLVGWQWVALISPLFITLLLTKISGIPMLEKKADKRWGGQPDYEEYKKNTPVLVPFIG